MKHIVELSEIEIKELVKKALNINGYILINFSGGYFNERKLAITYSDNMGEEKK